MKTFKTAVGLAVLALVGFPDSLPRRLLADLGDTHPPKWFPYYMVLDEDQFQKYLEEQGR